MFDLIEGLVTQVKAGMIEVAFDKMDPVLDRDLSGIEGVVADPQSEGSLLWSATGGTIQRGNDPEENDLCTVVIVGSHIRGLVASTWYWLHEEAPRGIVQLVRKQKDS